MRHSLLSTLLVIAAVVLVSSAHVTVSPKQMPAKGNGDFIVRVPTEKPVPTVGLRLEFPSTLRVTRIRAKLGWTAQVQRDTSKAITGVVWTGGKIGPDEYDEFAFSARINGAPGDTLAIKAYQTYEGGEVVEWTETVDPKPKHPAPKIVLVEPPSKYAGNGPGTWLGGAALVLGLVSLTLSMRNGKNGDKA
jgi:uncharacterized protein YcnI